MQGRLDRILELMDIAGKRNDPELRHIVRRLMLKPEKHLEDLLIRKLTLEAGEAVIEQAPFRSITPLEMDDVEPLQRLGHAARFERGLLVATQPFEFRLSAGHRLFTGSTRSGKSCAVSLMVQGLPTRTKTWILDPENDRVYVNLAIARGFWVIDCYDFRRNLLEPPPNCDPTVWDGAFKRLMRESCFLRDGSISMLSKLLDECRKDGGPITLRTLLQKLIKLRFRLASQGREFGFFETLRNRVEGLLVQRMFDCVRGFDLSFLASQNVLFLCRSLGSDDFVLFVNDVLSWLSAYFEPDLDPEPKMAVVLEEVHRLTNAQRLRRADVAEPILLDAVRTLAKRRVSLWCVDQVPSTLPTEILAERMHALNLDCARIRKLLANRVSLRDRDAQGLVTRGRRNKLVLCDFAQVVACSFGEQRRPLIRLRLRRRRLWARLP